MMSRFTDTLQSSDYRGINEVEKYTTIKRK